MAKVGGGNPIPFEIGGGPSSSELAYQALRAAVGAGGSAADGTIEAAWRMARARGLRAAYCDGRAAACFFPDRSVDSIPVYEAVLGLVSSIGASEEERRQANVVKWVGLDDVSSPAVEEALQAIDPLFSLLDTDRVTAVTTEHGRAFEDWTPADPDACGPAFGGGRSSTGWPNYGSDFHCLILYALPSAALSAANRRTIEAAKAVLNEMLPAWIDWLFTRTITGFILDLDLLDLEGFGT